MSTGSQAVSQGLAGLVPMIPVADVRRSIEFYRQLGFKVGNEWQIGGQLKCAYLENGEAAIFLSLSERPLNPGAQNVLFYMYAKDVDAYHAELKGKGLKVGDIRYPFYSPKGEFRIDDIDGYSLLVGHAD